MKKLFFRKIVRDQKGSMDKILVTLLLVIIAVGALVGFNSWATNETDNLKDTATNTVHEARDSI